MLDVILWKSIFSLNQILKKTDHLKYKKRVDDMESFYNFELYKEQPWKIVEGKSKWDFTIHPRKIPSSQIICSKKSVTHYKSRVRNVSEIQIKN